MTRHPPTTDDETLEIQLGTTCLLGGLAVPENARGVVLFVQSGGSVRESSRERHVATLLQEEGFATMLLDLLTPEERLADEVLRHLRYDVDRISARVIGAVDWLTEHETTADSSIGCLGLGAGAAASLVAAAERPTSVAAVVCRGGRPDLAGAAVDRVHVPTLFILGGEGTTPEELSLDVMHRIPGETGLAVVPSSSPLFEEPAVFTEVTALTVDWFDWHLVRWMRRSGERVIPVVQAARRAARHATFARRGM